MLSHPVPSLALQTPLGVEVVVPAPAVAATAVASWRRVARITGKVIAACGAALAAGFAISLGVAAAFLLIAVAVG